MRTSSWRPKAKVWARPSMTGPVDADALAAAAWMASVSSSAVAQAGGGVSPPSGPSRRMTAWKWTAPRFWYSATLAKETRAWSRKRALGEAGALGDLPAEVDGEAPPERPGVGVPEHGGFVVVRVRVERGAECGVVLVVAGAAAAGRVPPDRGGCGRGRSTGR